MVKGRPNVFEYLDYRKFLQDMYDFLKANQKGFSFRRFGQMAGLDSPNYLKMVMEGMRNLGAGTIPKFSKGLKLNKQEGNFFDALVAFTQAKSSSEKQSAYERMSKILRMKGVRELETNQYEYFSKWYHPVVRELVVSDSLHANFVKLGQLLRPAISEREVKDSVQLLLSLGLITQEFSGKYRQTEPAIASAPEIQSLALFKFHEQMIQNAKNALAELGPKERDITGLTLGIPKEDLPKIKGRLLAFRRSLLAEFGSRDAVDDVYQINIQVFPLTRLEEWDQKEK